MNDGGPSPLLSFSQCLKGIEISLGLWNLIFINHSFKILNQEDVTQ